MTYPEALAFLGAARFFGMKPGLDRMRRLAAHLGHPQKDLRFIHIAGTNGKGSTAAFCESCLRASGYRTGLYTSPHLVSIRERIQIDRVHISEADFAAGMEAVRAAVNTPGNEEATFFEITTALALWYFAREKVEFVVWETGLGGRLDATNIVDPEVCIITNIGLDHQQYLGQTLGEIAAEKAGIIKEGVPVVSAVRAGEAETVIRRQVESRHSRLVLVPRDMPVKDMGLARGKQRADIGGRSLSLGLLGTHQIENAACAVAALRELRAPALTDVALAQGLEAAAWPGRFDILSEKPLIVLDGAHNAAATQCLIATWRDFLKDRNIIAPAHLVFAAVADKDISEMAQLLRPLAQKVSLVRLANERSADPNKLADAFTGLPCAVYNSVSDAWQVLATADPEQPVLITGSLFLAGEMLARQQGHAEEYRLNERLEKISTGR